LFNIPTVLTADEIVDKAFRRASKVEVFDKIRIFRERKTQAARIDSSSAVMVAVLQRFIDAVPTLERLHPFYRDLIHIHISIDDLKQSLGALNWAKNKITAVASVSSKQILRSRNQEFVHKKRGEAYGRCVSLLKQIDKDLSRLAKMREFIKTLPRLDEAGSCIVVGGYPNVGKSTLIRRVSTAEIEVAPYPFTTKNVQMGHFEFRRCTFQLMDTPGVLHREKKNEIENRALIALKHAASSIIFVLDPSATCGYPVDDQIHLLDTFLESFHRPMRVLISKADLVSREELTAIEDRVRERTGITSMLTISLVASEEDGSGKVALPEGEGHPDIPRTNVKELREWLVVDAFEELMSRPLELESDRLIPVQAFDTDLEEE